MENDYVTKPEAAATKLELLDRMEATRLELVERLETTKLELLERSEKVETTLLKEFRKWAMNFESGARVNEFTVAGLHERMGLIEGRVSELENPS